MPTLDSYSLQHDLVERLIDSFRAAGWEIVATPDPHCDLLVSNGIERYAIEVKSAKDSRRTILEAFLAKALLQAQVYASRLAADPLPIVGAPLLTDRMVSDLKTFMQTYAPGAAFGLVDLAGRLELSGPGLDTIEATPDHRELPRSRSPQPTLNLFSDLNQWLLKVLLAPRLDLTWINAPRQEFKNAAELSRVAKVSLPTAARFVNQLTRSGYLDASRRKLTLVRRDDLFKQWARIPNRPRAQLKTRFLFRSDEPPQQLRKALASYAQQHRHASSEARQGRRACLALFSAAEIRGLGFVRGVPEHLYVERLQDQVLEELGLVEVSPGEQAEVVVMQPTYPEAVFRPLTMTCGVPVADVLQTWLDVADYSARGQEQASHLWNRIRGGLCEDS